MGSEKQSGSVVTSICPPASQCPVALVKRPVPPVASAVSWLSYTPGVSVGQRYPRKCRKFRRRRPQTSQRCQCTEYYLHKIRDGFLEERARLNSGRAPGPPRPNVCLSQLPRNEMVPTRAKQPMPSVSSRKSADPAKTPPPVAPPKRPVPPVTV